jgi:tetratricopeptide (TPR) repeat protein
MKFFAILFASLISGAVMSPLMAERLPYLRYDEDPFRLEYESAGNFDRYFLLASAQEAERLPDWNRAFSLYQELHRVDPTNPDHLFAMARVVYQLHRAEEALIFCERLPAGYHQRDVTLLKALSLLFIGRYQEAIGLFGDLLDEDPHRLPVMLGMAEALMALHHYDEAADLFTLMLAIHPAVFDRYPDLRASLMSAGANGPERAAFVLKRYAQTKTLGTFFSPIDAATISFTQVDQESAIEMLLNAVKADPGSAMLHARLGLFYRQLGQPELARHHMDKASELSPNNLDVINNRGVLAMQLGDDDLAIASFKRATELKPDYAEAFRNLARMYYLKEEWQASSYAAQQSLIVDQDSVNARLLVGFSNYKLGDYREALRYLEPVLNNRLDRSSIWFLAGISAHRLGRIAEAGQYYRKGLMLRPDDVLGLNNLADLLVNDPNANADDLREALALAERASELTSRKVKKVETTLLQVQERSAAMGRLDQP